MLNNHNVGMQAKEYQTIAQITKHVHICCMFVGKPRCPPQHKAPARVFDLSSNLVGTIEQMLQI